MTDGSLKAMVLSHVLHVINTANFHELRTLRGIGKVRATAILTFRNGGGAFSSIEDLEEVGMTTGAIRRFLQANVGALFA